MRKVQSNKILGHTMLQTLIGLAILSVSFLPLFENFFNLDLRWRQDQLKNQALELTHLKMHLFRILLLQQSKSAGLKLNLLEQKVEHIFHQKNNSNSNKFKTIWQFQNLNIPNYQIPAQLLDEILIAGVYLKPNSFILVIVTTCLASQRADVKGECVKLKMVLTI